MDTGKQPPDNTGDGGTVKIRRVATFVPQSIAPVATFSALACQKCGSLLDAPRINPLTGRPGRKCGDCGRWQEGPSPFRRWHESLPPAPGSA